MCKLNDNLSMIPFCKRNTIMSNIYRNDNDIIFTPNNNFNTFLEGDYELFDCFKKLKVKIMSCKHDGTLERLKECSVVFTSKSSSSFVDNFPLFQLDKKKGKFRFKTRNNYFPTNFSYINLYHNKSKNLVIDLWFEVFFYKPLSSKVSHNCQSLNYALTSNAFLTKNIVLNDSSYNPSYINLDYNKITNKFLLKMRVSSMADWCLEYFSKRTKFILYGDKEIVSDILSTIGQSYMYSIKTNNREGEHYIDVYNNIKVKYIETVIKKTLDKFNICDHVEMYYVFLSYSDIDKFDKDDIKAYLIHVLFHTNTFCNNNANKLANKIFSMMTKEQISKMERFHKLNNFII